MSKGKTKKKGKPVKTYKKRKAATKQGRTMPKYFYAQVKSALSTYFKENDIDYYECGSFLTITRKCYYKIKEDWIERGVPLRYALENIDQIYKDICSQYFPGDKRQALIDEFSDKTIKWWYIVDFAHELIESKNFDKEKDTCYYNKFRDGSGQTFLWNSDESTGDDSVRAIYRDLKKRIKEGGVDRYTEFSLYQEINDHTPNTKGGYDYRLKFDFRGISDTSFTYRLDHEDRGFKSHKSKEQYKKEKELLDLEQKTNIEAKSQQSQPSNKEIEELKKQIFDIQESHKKEITELKESYSRELADVKKQNQIIMQQNQQILKLLLARNKKKKKKSKRKK